jgi:hypothetical protein
MDYTQASCEDANENTQLKTAFSNLIAAFNSVPDPRQSHNRTYSLISLL